MRKIIFFLIVLFTFQCCVFKEDTIYNDSLYEAIDSLEIEMLLADSIELNDIEQYEINNELLGTAYNAIPYYMLRAKQDSKSCYKVYELSKNVPYKSTAIQHLGIKFLQKGAMMQDSVCINELNRIEYGK